MNFKKRGMTFIAVIICLSVVSITGIAAASTGNLTTISQDSNFRLSENRSAQNQFDSKSKCIDKSKGKKARHWKSITSKNIGSKLQAAVDAGKITQEEADAKLEFIAQAKGKKIGHWKSITSKNIGSKLQAAVDAGKITQEEANAKLECLQGK